MSTFEFVLRNEKQKLYDRFALFVLLVNTGAILYFFLPQFNGNTKSIFLIALLIFAMLAGLVPALKKKVSLFFIALAIAICWTIAGYWWAGVVTGLLYFLYLVAKRPLKVRISANLITYPSFPPRSIQWNELSNLVLKDGLLTIDFRNNRIIQQPIESNGASASEKEFNEFCKQQLTK